MNNYNRRKVRHTTNNTKMHHTQDSSEEFKNRSFMSMRRRKAMAKILYAAMCIIATIIVAACVASVFL